MVKSHSRGHQIIFINNKWVYSDNLKSIKSERRCVRCGNFPTKDGHDSCFGKMKNVKYACCGHGVTKPIIIKE